MKSCWGNIESANDAKLANKALLAKSTQIMCLEHHKEPYDSTFDSQMRYVVSLVTDRQRMTTYLNPPAHALRVNYIRQILRLIGDTYTEVHTA